MQKEHIDEEEFAKSRISNFFSILINSTEYSTLNLGLFKIPINKAMNYSHYYPEINTTIYVNNILHGFNIELKEAKKLRNAYSIKQNSCIYKEESLNYKLKKGILLSNSDLSVDLNTNLILMSNISSFYKEKSIFIQPFKIFCCNKNIRIEDIYGNNKLNSKIIGLMILFTVKKTDGVINVYMKNNKVQQLNVQSILVGDRNEIFAWQNCNLLFNLPINLDFQDEINPLAISYHELIAITIPSNILEKIQFIDCINTTTLIYNIKITQGIPNRLSRQFKQSKQINYLYTKEYHNKKFSDFLSQIDILFTKREFGYFLTCKLNNCYLESKNLLTPKVLTGIDLSVFEMLENQNLKYSFYYNYTDLPDYLGKSNIFQKKSSNLFTSVKDSLIYLRDSREISYFNSISTAKKYFLTECRVKNPCFKNQLMNDKGRIRGVEEEYFVVEREVYIVIVFNKCN